jgi:hypothetical protein
MKTRVMPGELPRTAIVRVFAALALILVLLIPLAPAARAQSACVTHAEMVEHLTQKYAEAQIAIAFTGNGQLIEVFTTGDGATWTIVITTPQGLSCILIAGETWDERRRIAEDPQA